MTQNIVAWSEVQVDLKAPPMSKGAFGYVYRAKSRGAPVALKLLLEGANYDPNAILHEIEVMSILKHPNVVLWMGMVTGGGRYGILMALEKQSLEEVLYRPNAPLDPLKKWKFTLEICRGMCWLYTHQVFHRDLKPDNILISQNEECKISDFGLSRILPAYESVSEKVAIGSRLWMSPEVLQGTNITSKADVYSFGLIVWQIFTQQALFKEYLDISPPAEALRAFFRGL
uniref:Protein kinase domain-containing protein n=1 Tax=Arcella intermedia TaxID=1963864 RepID=A0A6B2LGQ1_9EUKA